MAYLSLINCFNDWS